MRARPILFSGPMVRALLDGRKTQTRRVVKLQPWKATESVVVTAGMNSDDWIWPNPTRPNVYTVSNRSTGPKGYGEHCPYGQPGVLLWVRETWGRYRGFGHEVQPDAPVIYRADKDDCGQYPCLLDGEIVLVNDREPWKPSIHMPRWASRLTLELTEVRVERLQDISEADARAEGIEPLQLSLPGGSVTSAWRDYQRELIATPNPVRSYESLWETINGTGAWDKNPWVWCLSFRVHHQNVDAVLAAKAVA